jgi:hypothetical protein
MSRSTNGCDFLNRGVNEVTVTEVGIKVIRKEQESVLIIR